VVDSERNNKCVIMFSDCWNRVYLCGCGCCPALVLVPMALRSDLSAISASFFKSIRRSSSPLGVVKGCGCGIVTSSSWSIVAGVFVCFAGGDRRIIMFAGL
jgi:hypothetical protein